jgi:DnaK suppressor protein
MSNKPARPDHAFIERQRKRLLALRAEISKGEDGRASEARSSQEEQGGEAQEYEERAQDLEKKEIYQALHDVDQRRLENIVRALQKIDDGTYGFSDVSGAPISEERLLANPEATKTAEEESAGE